MPDRKALIIANDVYDHPGLQRLHSPAADADALAQVLADRAISDFDVRVVRNETSPVIQAELEDLFTDSRPDEVLLVHFSCHGLKNQSGELYFAARNTRPERLGSSAVAADFVQRCMRDSRSRSIVLLLDCCYGGAFGQGVAVRAAGDANVLDSFSGGRGRAVITASNAIEYAFEGDRLGDEPAGRPSMFTGALVEGLRTGEADRDEDGLIALGELYDYVFDRVRRQNPRQTPSRDIEMQGELYLARSRRRRIEPQPVPPDLAAAIADPNMFTRLGAVAELRRRLASDRLPVAVAAFRQLEHLAGNDIPHIADAARAAQQDAAIRVADPRLRFGPVEPGQRERRSVQLTGPPVARSCTFEASEPWIQVTVEDDGLRVDVAAESEGRREGTIVLKSPVGETVLTVELDVRTSVPATAPPAPAREEPPADRTSPPDPVGVIAGSLGVLGAIAMLIGLISNVGGWVDMVMLIKDIPGLAWYVVVVLLVAAGGLEVAVRGLGAFMPRLWPEAGTGLLIGSDLAATWGLAFLFHLGAHLTSSGNSRLSEGITIMVIGHIVALAGMPAALWSAWRTHGLRIRQRPDPRTVAAILLGVLGATIFVLEFVLAGQLPQYIAGAAVTLVVPIFAGSARPLRFGAAIAAGWALSATAVAVTMGWNQHYAFAVIAGLGVVHLLTALLCVLPVLREHGA